MKQPQLGWTTPIKVKRVIDGDTIVAEITKEITIRITDEDGTFNTPEIRNATDAEEYFGELAKTTLINILDKSKEVVMFVPTDIDGQLKDIFSIGARVVGYVFADEVDITETLTDMGYNKSKNEQDKDN
jgi:endonuclease YncB( thermonuclease family)